MKEAQEMNDTQAYLPTVAEFLAHEYPMALDEDFDGACPCSVVRGDGFKVETHCWRTSARSTDGKKCACRWSGVHVSGTVDEATAQQLGEHMRDNNGWTNNTDWEVVVD